MSGGYADPIDNQPDHVTTIAQGGVANFTVECACGKTWGVVSALRERADESAAQHVAAFEPFVGDPFEGLS